MSARILLILPIAFLLYVAGCQRQQNATDASTPAASTASDAPIEVTVAGLKQENLNWFVEQPGSLHAFESTPLVAKLSGYVTSLAKDMGDPVNAGEILARIAIPELECEHQQKLATVTMTIAEVEQAKRSLEVATEQVRASEAMINEVKAAVNRSQADYERWQSEYQRIDTMVSQKVIDKQTLDETKMQFRSAAAMREEANAKLVSAQSATREAEAKKQRAVADIQAAQARQSVAEAEVKRLQALLEYRDIKSPFNGFITSRNVHSGHFLQPTGGRSEPIFTVARTDIIRVFVDVPEAAAAHVEPGAKVVVRVPSLSAQEFPSTVTRTARVLNPETRTLRTEIDLPNPVGKLKPGMYATVRIAITTANAWIVPTGAILFADETAYCYAVDNGKVVKLRVQVGRSTGQGIHVLAKRRAVINGGEWEPILGTEQVVVGNLGALADGQAVKIKPAAEPKKS